MPDFDYSQLIGQISPPPPAQNQASYSDLASILGYESAPSPATPELPLASRFPHADPNNAAVVPASTQLAPPASVGVGAKVGASGYSPTANAAIQRGPKSALDKQLAADRTEIEGQFAPIQQTEHQAAAEAGAAALDAGRLESQKLAITSEARGKVAAANQEFMAKEQFAQTNAATESQTNIANYRAAIADYAASGVNPSQLWENAGKAGQIGMVATAFMHDFLAAKGVQTTGLESLNRSIQHNISAQLENMHKKLDVASGFKTVWEMQRLQSATDVEARARMNGFYLAAIDNQLQSQLGSYDSKLAMVKAQAAHAAIQQEMAKNDIVVQKHIDDAANQRAQNRVHMYSAELAASSAKYTADAHLKAAEIAAGKNQVSPLAGVVFDTSKSGGNLAKRRLLVEDKEGKIRTQAANVYNTVGNIEHLIDLQQQIAKAPPDIGISALKRMQNEEQRVAELVRNSVKMGIIYDQSGKQINEQEVKLYDELVGKKDWFLNGDNVRTLGTLAKAFLDKENAMLSGISTEILPGDPAYGVTSGNRNMAPGEQALTEIQSGPNAGRHENTEAENAIKAVTSPKADEPAFEGPGILRKAAHGVAGAVDSTLGTNLAAPDRNTKTGSGLSNEEWGARNLYDAFLKTAPFTTEQKEEFADPSKSFVGIVKLGTLAQQGDPKAREALLEFATNPPKEDSLVSYYAKWELSQLSK